MDNSRLARHVPSAWRLLAADDNGDSWEIDVTEIWIDETGRLLLVQASGCSCWDGDYTAEGFNTLNEVAHAVSILGQARPHHITPAGGEALVNEARRNLRALLAVISAEIGG